MLEDIYSALAPVETKLHRKFAPTLYTTKEFDERKAVGSAFLTRVLADEHLVLIGTEDEPSGSLIIGKPNRHDDDLGPNRDSME